MDVAKFTRAYQSVSIEADRQAGIAELKRDQISTVPTVVLDKRWVVSPTTAGGIAAAISVMDGRVDAPALRVSKAAGD